jgi:hypothetical protein
MILRTGPDWDFKERCMWFEIQHHVGQVLCRIDSGCFLSSLGADSPSPIACRRAFQSERKRILAIASALAFAGHFDTLPDSVRRFIWLKDDEFRLAVT